jgi:hypothetical protein
MVFLLIETIGPGALATRRREQGQYCNIAVRRQLEHQADCDFFVKNYLTDRSREEPNGHSTWQLHC